MPSDVSTIKREPKQEVPKSGSYSLLQAAKDKITEKLAPVQAWALEKVTPTPTPLPTKYTPADDAERRRFMEQRARLQRTRQRVVKEDIEQSLGLPLFGAAAAMGMESTGPEVNPKLPPTKDVVPPGEVAQPHEAVTYAEVDQKDAVQMMEDMANNPRTSEKQRAYFRSLAERERKRLQEHVDIARSKLAESELPGTLQGRAMAAQAEAETAKAAASKAAKKATHATKRVGWLEEAHAVTGGPVPKAAADTVMHDWAEFASEHIGDADWEEQAEDFKRSAAKRLGTGARVDDTIFQDWKEAAKHAQQASEDAADAATKAGMSKTAAKKLSKRLAAQMILTGLAENAPYLGILSSALVGAAKQVQSSQSEEGNLMYLALHGFERPLEAGDLRDDAVSSLASDGALVGRLYEAGVIGPSLMDAVEDEQRLAKTDAGWRAAGATVAPGGRRVMPEIAIKGRR